MMRCCLLDLEQRTHPMAFCDVHSDANRKVICTSAIALRTIEFESPGAESLTIFGVDRPVDFHKTVNHLTADPGSITP